MKYAPHHLHNVMICMFSCSILLQLIQCRCLLFNVMFFQEIVELFINEFTTIIRPKYLDFVLMLCLYKGLEFLEFLQVLFLGLRKIVNEADKLPCTPMVATQTNNYMGLVQDIHKGIDYVHIIIHTIQIMFQIFWSQKFQKRTHQDKLGRKLELGITSQNSLYYLQFVLQIIKLQLGKMLGEITRHVYMYTHA